MANNILITPASASIQFSGSTANTIRLVVEDSGSVAFYGNSGSLFGISDSLSGSLMSVNDISGFPILEVTSDDTVTMGTWNADTLVVTGSLVGIRNAAPTHELSITGDISASGDITASAFVGDGANVTGVISSSHAISAVTASYADGFINFPSGLSVTGSLTVDGTASLDVVDIDGAVDMASTLTVAGDVTVDTSTLKVDTSNNRVGIGTTSPLDLLHIKSTSSDARIFLDAHTASDAELKFAEAGTVKYTIGYDAATQNLVVGTTNVDTGQRLVIDSSGNVGIGTTSPLAQLHVQDTTAAEIRIAGTNSSAKLTLIAPVPSIALTDTSGGATDTVIQQNSSVLTIYNNGAGLALDSAGNLSVSGALSKASGTFKIDHPLPSKVNTHHLVHSFIEGPRADLIYRGSATLLDGVVTVDLDTAATMTEGTWELLCRNPQVWVQNESGWSLIRGSVSGSTLTITAQDNTSTDTVSWLVVAERKDDHIMNIDWTDDDGRVIVEPIKPI